MPHVHQTRGCRRYTSSRTIHSAEHWRAPPLTAPHDAVPHAEMTVQAWNGPLSSTTSTSADSQFHQALAVAGRRRLGLCPRGSHGLQPSPPRRRRSCRSCRHWDRPIGRMPASQGVGRWADPEQSRNIAASTQVAFPLLSRDDVVQPVEPHLGSILSSGQMARVDISVQVYPARSPGQRQRPAGDRAGSAAVTGPPRRRRCSGPTRPERARPQS